MAYTDGKAAPRVSPTAPEAGVKAAAAPANKSNQMKSAGQTSLFRGYSEASKVPVGNQVRVDRAGKGLGRAGVPSAMALGSKDKALVATENPSGKRNIPGTKRL